jgi:hypothetical protein
VDLEKRVQVLEQEVQVLKNQIQATLLDIQEQILTNTYPSLRAESALAAGNSVSAPATVSTPQANLSPAETTPAPVVKKVSLESPLPIQESAPPHTTHPPAPLPAVLPDAPPVPDIDWDSLAQVEEWVANRVEKMGTRRTRKLIEMYLGEGRFPLRTAEALLRLVSVFEEEGGASPSPFEEEPVFQQYPAPPVMPVPGSEQAIYPEPAGYFGGSNGSEPVSPFIVQPDEKELEPPQNLILRLIAGVQNAGIRSTRKKNHG